MRGRETMISLTGLLILTGRYNEAKYILLTFASVMRHGLIPNIIDSGVCRYNARDVTWFFLQALQNYIKNVPDGPEILNENVTMKFRSDKYDEHLYFRENPVYKLHEIIQKILQSHASGIKFREWNAGAELDPFLSSNGFNIEISLDSESGLLVGGNEYNNGT